MSSLTAVAVVGTLIAVLGIALIVLFLRRLRAQREEQQLATQVFLTEPTDVYREELNDRYSAAAFFSSSKLLGRRREG